MAQLTIIGSGLLATLLAALQLAAWLAMGLALTHGRAAPPSLPIALLLGAAVSAALAAGLAALGLVAWAAAAPAALGLAALAWRRRAVWGAARRVWARLRALAGLDRPLPEGRAERAVALLLPTLCALLALAYWLTAVAPPRDGDVLRYHLAHIRQIVQDGGWQPIADYHYALPFGWSLGYLPFVLLGLPQGAHMLNLGLLVIAAAVLFGLLRGYAEALTARLLTLAFALHPAVLQMSTTARADMYLVFVVLALTAALVGLRAGDSRDAAALGFVAWVGMQSRYQAAALGLAAAALLLLFALRRRVGAGQLLAFAGGGAAALALSAPFYLFNWLHLGNPVWPLLTQVFNRPPAYADLVAEAYNRSLNGRLAPETLARALWRLVTAPTVFPIPLAALAFLAAALRWRASPAPVVALFLGAFLLLWAVAQPRLYPRFSLIVLVPTLVGWGPVLASWSRHSALCAGVRAALAAMLALFLALSGAYALDYLAYAATGDAARFHASTWYKATYDWVNAETPADSRALVVVTSGHSFYLDRQYRRADPEYSGVVDWPAVHGPADLARVMRAGGFDLLIYEDRDWSRAPGGRAMASAVAGARADGTLVELAAFDEYLSTSRLRGEGYESTVRVLRLP